MNRNYILISLAIAAVGFFAFEHTTNGKFEVYTNTVHLFAAGGQPGKTGAPGEVNCTQCHTGTVQNGIVENQVIVRDASFNIVTSYIPGETYLISLQMASNPSKKGFSSTILDLSDLMAGTLVGDPPPGFGGTQDFVGGAREYVSHLSTSNTSAQSFWSWDWIAPATDVGDVIIYIASNSANGNNNSSGDVIFTSQHIIASTLGVNEETAEKFSFKAGYNGVNHQVNINFNSLVSGEMFFNLVDLNGKSVFTYQMGNALVGENYEVISLPADLTNGMYVVHYFVGNKAMSANIMVQK